MDRERDADLNKLLHTGVSEDKTASLLLPGAKARKRYSLGKLSLILAESIVLIQTNDSFSFQLKLLVVDQPKAAKNYLQKCDN